jgi:DNA-binding NtrC family response regulator
VGDDAEAEAGVAGAAPRGGDRHDRAARGESGTGKELFARALHALSPRSDGPFVAINCAAIPENLLETSCSATRKGRSPARRASRASSSSRTRHAVSRRDRRSAAVAFRPRFCARSRRSDRARRRHRAAQVDVASSRRPTAISRRRWRRVSTRDLYFRLSVFPILIPPLRDRLKDIPTLARYFIDKFCRDLNKKPLVLSPAAEEDLVAYPWPGNVRELQNCIERAAILTEGETIHPRHLNLSFRSAAAPVEEGGGRGRRSISRGPWPEASAADAARSRAAQDSAGHERVRRQPRRGSRKSCRSASRRSRPSSKSTGSND